jgi:hypothetical protein
MKGTLHKTEQGWTVRYLDYKKAHDIMYCGESLPLHPDDLDSDIIRWAENGSLENKEVEFEITDEFTHPELYRGVGWGDGIKYAKLIKYPELEGTNALCEDIINKREAPYISDDFQIGPEGAYEHNEDAMEKLRSRNYLDDNRELDAFHYHELLDRLTIVHEMIENCLISHPVCEEHMYIKELVEKAQEFLADAYMEMGSIIAARDINI